MARLSKNSVDAGGGVTMCLMQALGLQPEAAPHVLGGSIKEMMMNRALKANEEIIDGGERPETLPDPALIERRRWQAKKIIAAREPAVRLSSALTVCTCRLRCVTRFIDSNCWA